MPGDTATAIPGSENETSSVIERLERASPFFFGLLILYSFVMGLVKVSSSPLWNDEVITWIIARQPTFSMLWHALARGADGQPPFYYLIVRFFCGSIGNPHIALRLPSILGFCCTLACVYVFARKRGGPGLAAVCIAILLNSVLCDDYALQGRTYSLTVAAVAFAMVCYQRADELIWNFLLGFSLAFSSALHYYAVFALGAFGAAEIALFLSTRKFRWGVWLALFFGSLPLIVYWPLLNEQRVGFGAHFWGRPKLSLTLATYGNFFHVPVYVGIGVAGFLGFSLLMKGEWSNLLRKVGAPVEDTLLHEHTLLLALLGMPLAVFVMARLAHGGFLDRYVLWSALPMVLIPCYLLPRFRAQTLLVLAVFLLAAAAREVPSLVSYRGHFGKIDSPALSAEKLVDSAGIPGLPVAVSSNNDYIQIFYYASPTWNKRFVAIEDPASAVAYIGTDTSDRELPVLADYAALQVYDFATFSAAHHEFLLYSTSEAATAGPYGFYDRWVPKLLKDGYSLSTVAAEGNRRVYLVHAPSP